MARTNLCPNPALKNDATGWFGGGTRVTGVAGMARTTGYQNAAAETTLPRGTVTAGLTYRFSAYVKGTGGGSSGNANINWYSGGTYLASAPGQGWVVTTGNVTRIESGAQVAPAGATQGLLNITGADAQIQVTAVLYEQTSQLFEFFDGDSADSSWNGTSGNSTSTTTVGDSGGDEPPPNPGGGSDEAGVTQSWGTPIWQTEFNDPAELTNGTWGLYDGPGHNGNGTRDPERISITGGLLRITGLPGGSTGGMSHHPVHQQYGRWEIRMRAYTTGQGSGSQYHAVGIVWPDSENWPDDGEYDFIENDVGDTAAGAFLHYPHPDLPVQQEHATKSGVSIADWHNYAFEWQPSGLKGYIDGVLWYTYSGGAGPGGRRNIQTMPSGHLTLQLDNFGGATHKQSNMDVDWVRIYDNESVASNNTITCTGIPSPNTGGFNGFGVPTVGNRFRLYLNNAAGAVTPTAAAGWDQTAGAATGKLLGRTRTGTNTAVTVAETSTSNIFDSLLGQWISDPFTSSGTVQGAWQWCVAGFESNVAADIKMAGVVRVVSGDGTVVRGTFADTIMSGEMGTVNSSFIITAGAGSPVAAQLGDRMVVEFGYRATNTVTTSYSMTLRYGGTSTTDLEAGLLSPTDDTALTTRSPWVEFADGAIKALFTGQTVLPSSIASAEAFGSLTVTVPPTRAITGAGGIASAEAIGSVVVTAEAAIIAPASIFDEAFGVPSVSNTVIVAGIATLEAFGTPRVRRLSDIAVDDGIPTAEAFGVLVVVHFQEIAPSGIESLEAFGGTQVEDPNRRIFPFGIPGAEAFGAPVLRYRIRTKSIGSGEQFGIPTLRVAVWKLVQPTRIERWRLGDPGNVIYVTNVVGLTVYGDDDVLFTIENPKTEQLDAAKYVWQGGHDNITTDQAIRDLWLAHGYQVEMHY